MTKFPNIDFRDLGNEPSATDMALGMVEMKVRDTLDPAPEDLFEQLERDVDDATRAVLRVRDTIDRLNESIPDGQERTDAEGA